MGRSGSVNQEGLAISSAAIWYVNKPKPGLRSRLPTRWILDTYSDTQSAVDYLKRIPHYEAVSFLIADQEGRIARVEAAPEGVHVALTQDGMLAAINLIRIAKPIVRSNAASVIPLYVGCD